MHEVRWFVVSMVIITSVSFIRHNHAVVTCVPPVQLIFPLLHWAVAWMGLYPQDFPYLSQSL